MRYIFPALIAATLAATPALAEPPSVEEYNQLREGVLLPETAEEKTVGEFNDNDKFRSAMTMEDILKLYRAEEYKKILPHIVPLAENGLHQAQEVLGIMYRMGQGIDKDPKQAYVWLLKAAEEKRPLSQHHLGIMHYLGEGVRQNIVRSMMWLRLAEIYYPEGANKERARTDYNNLVETTTRRDRTRADELVREWLEKKGDLYLLEQQTAETP